MAWRRPFAAVLFDLDGTLVDTETACRTAFHAALARRGLALSPQRYAALVGQSSRDRAGQLLAWFGADFDTRAFLTEYRRERDARLDRSLSTMPWAAPVLADLADAGLALGVATSASRVTAEWRLRRTGLRRYFAHVTTRDDVDAGKPAPAIFLRAARLLRLPAEDCLAVEDSGPGAAAALAAGMVTMLLPGIAPAPSAIAARCVRGADLRDVARLCVGSWRGASRPDRATRPVFAESA